KRQRRAAVGGDRSAATLGADSEQREHASEARRGKRQRRAAVGGDRSAATLGADSEQREHASEARRGKRQRRAAVGGDRSEATLGADSQFSSRRNPASTSGRASPRRPYVAVSASPRSSGRGIPRRERRGSRARCPDR